MERCIWYIDDVLIDSSKTEAEQQTIVEKVLQLHSKHGNTVYDLKSEYYVMEVIFLGHSIKGQEVKMYATKVKTMCKWPISKKKMELQAFLKFANYCSRFIVNYSAKVPLLMNLTNHVPLMWRHIQQQAIDELQIQFLSASILTQFNRILETIMETDCNN